MLVTYTTDVSHITTWSEVSRCASAEKKIMCNWGVNIYKWGVWTNIYKSDVYIYISDAFFHTPMCFFTHRCVYSHTDMFIVTPICLFTHLCVYSHTDVFIHTPTGHVTITSDVWQLLACDTLRKYLYSRTGGTHHPVMRDTSVLYVTRITWLVLPSYGLAMIRRLLEIIGLLCKTAL